MDESCSIQAPSLSCIKKTRRPKSSRKKSNFKGSPHFYPLITLGGEENSTDVGKYGRMWIDYIQKEYPQRYRSLVRFEELHDKATEVNEVAYELLEDIENEWLSKHKPKQANSFAEMYQLRTQARMIAEEVVLHDVVNCFH